MVMNILWQSEVIVTVLGLHLLMRFMTSCIQLFVMYMFLFKYSFYMYRILCQVTNATWISKETSLIKQTPLQLQMLSPPSHPKVLDSGLLTLGREAVRCADNGVKEPPLLDSPSSDTPRRRSLRQRKQVVNIQKEYTESPLKRRTSDKERNVQFKSPISSFKSPEERKCAQQTKSQDFIAKEHALDLLRSEEMNALRQKKSDYEQRIQEEKAKRKEETLLIRKSAKEERKRERAAKTEERKKAIEEKIRIKEELQLSKIRAQERMKLAQSVKKQAMKDLKKRQRENEKIRKQELLLELKEKNKEE